MGLAERIAEAIEGAKNPDGTRKTKAQIARECEVTSGAVSQWLSGTVKSLKADTALALEAATGYRAYWILHGKGVKTLSEPVTVWPFPKVSLEWFTSLDERDQGYVERRLLQAINEVQPVTANTITHSDERAANPLQPAATPAPPPATVSKSLPDFSTHPLERMPALKKALGPGEGKQRERSKDGGVQKPRTRRRA